MEFIRVGTLPALVVSMNSGWKLGRFFDIDVFVHWTFFLLLGWILLAGGGVMSAVFVCAIFACVVLHEYGHALAARYFGIPTRKITLYPIGGVAQLTRMPKRPAEEIIVALAGPAVNVVIAFMLALFLLVFGGLSSGFALNSLLGFLTSVMIANVILAGFNLLPAFPMDGGRVLRAWLSKRQGHLKATDTAAKVGKGFAAAFALIAIFQGMPTFFILAIFVFLMAELERRQAHLQARYGSFFGDTPPPRPGGDFHEIDVEVMPPPRKPRDPFERFIRFDRG